MGNQMQCCAGREEKKDYGFKEAEIESLSILFQKLVNSQPE